MDNQHIDGIIADSAYPAIRSGELRLELSIAYARKVLSPVPKPAPLPASQKCWPGVLHQ